MVLSVLLGVCSCGTGITQRPQESSRVWYAEDRVGIYRASSLLLAEGKWMLSLMKLVHSPLCRPYITRSPLLSLQCISTVL